ncbi:carbamoyltransferase HypF [Oscillatoria sp. FACHB-1407]|uniref:carbamoyltransferase HypF n=1 Tax=Oscillatoria sp. FACHB-1407 TaxID=2692847 RepID=UPI001687E7F1|nr:carbamoyltransferase HypF [Oscillatoria sp. FACHB-1407]MBD2465212.1 carbamoyltransferase HypF [Oscillatoria sp. FACHB-1407]
MTLSLNRLSASLQAVSEEVAETIRITGTVQGVGFRPTVYRLANQYGLRGEVLNDGAGVLIRAIGTETALDHFVQQLQVECPPLAKITAIARSPLSAASFTDFQIVESVATSISTEVAPDAATCPNCVSDTLDPFSRWYRYPFTNCTHCGPRLSIIHTIPYDRPNTSMAPFPMCVECAEAYHDVSDRRFHAQPVACHKCGPNAWLERTDGKAIVADMFSMMDDVDAACTLIQRGEIVAIKGIGGIHLACDATNEVAVQKLRQRKRRYDKPFALMARDLTIIEQYCDISPVERELLQSPAAPIVLLKVKQESTPTPHSLPPIAPLAPSLAPGLSTLGFMLPYTPLHHLMLRRMKRPIVLTSGNLSDEPQCITNDEARQRLGAIADFLLLHNRDIVNRVDDSVVRVVNHQPQILRRARGYAPAPIPLPAGFEQAPDLLAMGSELKSTFCLLSNGRAVLSQHLGDLENATAFAAYQDTLNLYLDLFQHSPEAIAIDQHPEYLSTKLGREFAEEKSLPIHLIQHHHAHVAACMAENSISLESPPVLGIALDGLGFGEDGTLWGGEFLLADYRQFQRVARLKPVAMLGGSQAIYQPWRNTYAHLMSASSWEELHATYSDLEIIQFLEQQPRSLLDQMLQKGIHSPLASSAGRLFDAVAAAIGLSREKVSYEGQAAIQLEALIQSHDLELAKISPYSFDLQTVQLNDQTLLELDSRSLWSALLQDLQQSTPSGLISAKFHLGFANAIAQLVQHLSHSYGFTHIALTGGVFQNEILTHAVQQQLSIMNFTVLTHHRVPPNDGGLSLGQGAIAAARSLLT